MLEFLFCYLLLSVGISLSISLANACQRHPDLLFAVQEIHQQNHALATVHGQENGFQLGEGPLADPDLVAGFEQLFSGDGAAALLQVFDQGGADGQRLIAEADYAADATGGTQRCPVVERAELDEQVAGEEGLFEHLPLAAQDAFADVPRTVAGIALA